MEALCILTNLATLNKILIVKLMYDLQNDLSRTMYDDDGMQQIQNSNRAVEIYISKARKV